MRIWNQIPSSESILLAFNDSKVHEPPGEYWPFVKGTSE